MYAERLSEEYARIWFLHDATDSSQPVDYFLSLSTSDRGRFVSLFRHLSTQKPPYDRRKYVPLENGYAELKVPNYRFVALQTVRGWVIGYGFKKPSPKKQDREIRRGIETLEPFRTQPGGGEYRE